MLITIENLDISSVILEEKCQQSKYGVKILYFVAPVAWLDGRYPDAIRAEISVEYPIYQPEAQFAKVMMSPTKEDENGNMKDYDWFDLELSDDDIQKLIELAEGQGKDCNSCPVRPCTASYQSYSCLALRAKAGADITPDNGRDHGQKEFCINIRETLEMQICVETSSLEEAIDLVRKKYERGDYVLDGNYFTGVEFEEVTD